MRLTLPFALVAVLAVPRPGYGWGPYGHEIVSRAAVRALPASMPGFFTGAMEQLAYLGGEPDRWRDARESNLDPALNGANGPEHYVDLEIVPPGGLELDDRYAFTRRVGDGALPGLSSYRMIELFQRVRLEFRLWREEEDPRVRSWIEQRIVNDAGILGHYVADAANPLHTTVRFDGWTGDNPEGYSTESGIHGRFESDYVDAHVSVEDLLPLVEASPRVWADPRRAILDHIEGSFNLVGALYRLDRELPFGETTDRDDHRRFATERLAAGAEALRDAWWSAWVSSEP